MSQTFSTILTVTTPEGEARPVDGVAYVWAEDRNLYANAGRALLRLGDTRSPLPSGNLLSPWRLMALMPTLKAAFPTLTDSHYAAMLSQAPPPSEILNEIADISGLNAETAFRAWLATLTGETLACLLVLKALSAQGETLPDSAHEPFDNLSVAALAGILRDPLAAPHRLLLDLTGFLLNHDQPLEETQSQPEEVCLPTLPLSAVEMAQLYHALTLPVPRDLLRMSPEEVEAMLHYWDEIAALLKSAAPSAGFLDNMETVEVKSRDAAGLLCVGIGANSLFADGLGIYIHLADAADASWLDVMLHALLAQLGFAVSPAEASKQGVAARFHFKLETTLPN